MIFKVQIPYELWTCWLVGLLVGWNVIISEDLFEFTGCSIILIHLYVRGDRAINIGHPLPEMPE